MTRSASCCWSADPAGCRPWPNGSSRNSAGNRGLPTPTSRSLRARRCTRRPDGPVRRGRRGAAAGQDSARTAPATAAPACPLRAGDRRGRAGGSQADRRRRGEGPRPRPAHRRQRAAQGRRRQARRHQQARLGDDPEARPTSSTLSTPQTQLPCDARTACRATIFDHQTAVEIEIWEQAGEFPEPRPGGQPPGGRRRPDRRPGPFRLPAGSPINIDIRIDAEGTVHLHAIEPTSGKDLEMNVRISALSQEQMEAAIEIHRGLTIGTS